MDKDIIFGVSIRFSKGVIFYKTLFGKDQQVLQPESKNRQAL